MEQKIRNTAISAEQKQTLLNYLMKHNQLIKGKFSATFTQKTAQKMWEELAENLNAIPTGSKKDWKQWRKVSIILLSIYLYNFISRICEY